MNLRTRHGNGWYCHPCRIYAGPIGNTFDTLDQAEDALAKHIRDSHDGIEPAEGIQAYPTSTGLLPRLRTRLGDVRWWFRFHILRNV